MASCSVLLFLRCLSVKIILEKTNLSIKTYERILHQQSYVLIIILICDYNKLIFVLCDKKLFIMHANFEKLHCCVLVLIKNVFFYIPFRQDYIDDRELTSWRLIINNCRLRLNARKLNRSFLCKNLRKRNELKI